MSKIKNTFNNTFKNSMKMEKKIYISMLRIQKKQPSDFNTSSEEYEFENKNKLNFKINIYLDLDH